MRDARGEWVSGPRDAWWSAAVAVVILNLALSCLFFAIVFQVLPRPGGDGAFWTILGSWGAVMLVGFVVSVVAIHREPRRVARCLESARCPSCDYDLEGARPALDGCTVCPECGAAWNMPAKATPPALPPSS